MNRLAKSISLFLSAAVLTVVVISGNQHSKTKVLAQSVFRLHTLQSKVFNNTRSIRVLLPPDYDLPANHKRRYPVLYLNDGQNLFDVSTSVFNPLEWEVDETFVKLIAQKQITPLIIVGIDNAGKRARPNEYLPYEDKFLTPPVASPEGKKFPDFLLEEVMPLINQTYRTQSDEAGTGIGGSSYGAVAALYAVMSKPGVFGKLLLESPSLYIGEGQLLKTAPNVSRWPGKIYLGAGTNEEGQQKCRPQDRSQDVVQDVLKLERVLRSAGVGKDRLMLRLDECAIHNETAWARRFPVALKFLYGREKSSK